MTEKKTSGLFDETKKATRRTNREAANKRQRQQMNTIHDEEETDDYLASGHKI